MMRIKTTDKAKREFIRFKVRLKQNPMELPPEKSSNAIIAMLWGNERMFPEDFSDLDAWCITASSINVQPPTNPQHIKLLVDKLQKEGFIMIK